MKRVLLAVDTDEARARRAAEGVASMPGAPDDLAVTVLNVFEEFTAADEAGQVRSKDLYDAEDFPDSVLAARDVLEGGDIDVELRRTHGDPAEQILAVAEDVDAAVAMAGRKRSPAGRPSSAASPSRSSSTPTGPCWSCRGSDARRESPWTDRRREPREPTGDGRPRGQTGDRTIPTGRTAPLSMIFTSPAASSPV